MILEKLMAQPKETMKAFLESLSGTDKTVLLNEIEANKKAAEDEFIRLETMKTKLEEDETIQMDKLKELGINSYSELDTEIQRLEDELNAKILEYAEALKAE